MSTPLPDYASPPVIEVVCGVTFKPLEGLKAVHLGMFWERFKDDFPEVQEHPPIATVMEQLGGPTPPTTEFQLVDTPPLPRVWFVDKTGNGIIQVQRDVLLHNWRKLAPTDQYPRFRTVFANFRSHLERFKAFVEEHSLGTILPVQCELTYINHVLESAHWTKGKPLSNLFPDFSWRNLNGRFLPEYEGANWRTMFRLPDENGRLHVTIQTAFRRPDNEPLVVLEMKARGIGKDRSLDALWAWFDVAHEWIVRGFADVTDKAVQRTLWGHKE